jgi:hypothetical protein
MPQHTLPVARIGKPTGQAVEEIVVVDSLGNVEEGPVGAPDASVHTEGIDQGCNEWLKVLIREWVRRNPEWRRELDDGFRLAPKPEHSLKSRLVETTVNVWFSQVSDENCHTAPLEWIDDVGPHLPDCVYLHEPAEGLNAGEESPGFRSRQRIRARADEVKSDTHNPLLFQREEIVVGCIR